MICPICNISRHLGDCDCLPRVKRFCVAALAALLTACGGGGSADSAPAESVAPQGPPKLRVYLFAGQSNMLGSDALAAPSGVQDLAEAGMQTATDRSTLFTFSTRFLRGDWGDVRGHAGYWQGEATIDGKPVKVHGPEVGFEREIGGDVAVIKYADNFTALENGRSPWARPGSRWAAWQTFVDAQLSTLGRPYEVAGIVWFQGIDDGLLKREREPYEADLRQIVSDLRAKFGPVPLVMVREIDSVIAGSAAMQPIRSSQDAAVASLSRAAIVSADDLPLATAHHLAAAGQLVLGQRIGAAMRGIR